MSEPKRDDEPTMEEILASIRKIISEDDPATAQTAAADETADAADDLDAGAPPDADSHDAEAEPMELTQMVSEDGSVVDLRAEQQASPPSVEEAPVAEEAPAEAPEQEGATPTVPDEESRPAIVEPLVPEDTRVHAELESEREDAVQASSESPEPAALDSEVDAGPDDSADRAEAEAAQASRETEAERLISAEATAAATAAMSRLKDRLAAGNLAVGGGSEKSLEALARETMAPHLKSWLDRNLPDLVERIVREEIEKLVKRNEPR